MLPSDGVTWDMGGEKRKSSPAKTDEDKNVMPACGSYLARPLIPQVSSTSLQAVEFCPYSPYLSRVAMSDGMSRFKDYEKPDSPNDAVLFGYYIFTRLYHQLVS